MLMPLFDSLTEVSQQTTLPFPVDIAFAAKDFQYALNFLISYKGSKATFNSYRREVERLLQWAWWIQKKSIIALRRADIEAYLEFCLKPPKTWIGVKKVPRFIVKDGLRQSNPLWRPFVATVSKSAHRSGKEPRIDDYQMSSTAFKEIFSILSSFYSFLMMEEITELNPVAQIRQKSKFLRRQQGPSRIRRLTDLQWQTVIETAERMATANPELHERTLFIMTALYAMYLRISELAASERWTPKMCDFYKDQENRWWFITVGKGNKERQIAVSDSMLQALKRYREHLNLSALPSPADTSPLLPKSKGHGPITSTTYIREIVQQCFDRAIEQLRTDYHEEDADMLMEATVHWLRHTGISDDVKRRPREHVRDDAGHSSGAITDRYIDVELRARHASARKKLIKNSKV